MDFQLHLVVENIEHLPLGGHDRNLVAKVEWRGDEKKAGFLARGFEKNYTCQQTVQANGTVSWNEGFDHGCKFERERSGIYKSWIIVLQIEEVQEKAREKMKNIGKAKVDVAEFIQLEKDKTIRIPINCGFGGHIAEAMLTVKLQLIKVESKALTRALSLYSFSHRPEPKSSNKTKSFNLSHHQSVNLPKADSEANLHILNETSNHYDSKKATETYIQQPSTKAMKQKQRSLAKLLFSGKTKLGHRGLRQPKGSPLLAKGGGGGGHYTDDEHHQQPCIPFLTAFKKVKVRPEENFKHLGFGKNHKFEAGQWKRKEFASRDDKMELVSDVFLASIDQRSKRAAGGSACTVLAAVIAEWLHNHPKSLPKLCQFEELVLKGSLEWRNLCAEENHKEKFSDKHFDLDTVIESKVRSLTVATEKSYVGFFSMEEMPEGFEWLQGDMSFDNIWNNILCRGETEERIYIVSWNDHFFVIKVESDAIYLLDTLGERLAEGCNQAYILKFDAESVIYRRSKDEKEGKSSDDLVSEGIACCKEYIKGFLSAIPLRELQLDIKRGHVKQELLHRLLQIDFHHTALSTRKNCWD